MPRILILQRVRNLLAGGAGSGCHGDNCGRPATAYKLPDPMSDDHAKSLDQHPTWVEHPKWYRNSYGGVVVSPNGNFLLREPTGHFDGYHWTFSKGGQENEHEHPVDVALREVQEETGRTGKIIDQLPGTYVSAPGKANMFYLMRSGGFDSSKMDRETKSTRWVSYEKAKELIGRSTNKLGRARDLAILDHAYQHIQQWKHGRLTASGLILIRGGGPGSGCHGDNCGRPAGAQAPLPAKNFATGVVLKQLGWKKLASPQQPNNIHDPAVKVTYSHPQHGLIHQTESGNYKHVSPTGQQLHYGVGKQAGGLKQYVKNVAKKAAPPVTPSSKLEKPKEERSVAQPPSGMPETVYIHEYSILGNPGTTYQWDPQTKSYVNHTNGLTVHWAHIDEGLQSGKLKDHEPVAKPVVPEPKINQEQYNKLNLVDQIKAPHGMQVAYKSVKTGLVYTYNPTSKKWQTPNSSPSSGWSKGGIKKNESAGKFKAHEPVGKTSPGGFPVQPPPSKPVNIPKPVGMADAYKSESTGKIYTYHEGSGNWHSNEQMATKTAATGYDKTAIATKAASGFFKPYGPQAPAYSFVSDASHLGGAHEKYFYKDDSGKQFLFKPATTLSGEKAPMMAHADELASKVSKLLRPDSNSPEIKTVTVDLPGKGPTLGSMAQMIPSDKLMAVKDFKSQSVKNIPDDQIKQIQQQHVVDWLISNHDAHGAQFLKTTDGKVVGIDQTQAFKYFPNDKLDPGYHPNAKYGESQPLYNTLMQAAKSGSVTLDPNAVLPTIKNAQKISDQDYRDMLKPYAVARVGAIGGSVADFLDKAVERKNNLMSDFQKLYADVTGNKDFKFDTASLHPPNPAPDKVAQPVHEALSDAGYKFDKYGKQTGFPLYKEANGELQQGKPKAVYVTEPNKWAYYPMGAGSNAYGSKTGEGHTDLAKALKDPFEAPSAPTPAGQSTKSYTEKHGMTPELQAKFDALPKQPWQDKHWNGSNAIPPTSVVEHSKSMSAAETAVLGSYKGTGYHDINGFLWKGGDAITSSKVKNMDSALTKSATNKDLVVWRNPGGSLYAKDLAHQLLSGATEHVPNCYQSTTTDKSFAKGWGYGSSVILQIHVPKGSPAYGWNSESEVMLDRNVKYTVNHLFTTEGTLYADVNAVFMPKKISASKELAKSAAEWAKEFKSHGSPEEAERNMASYKHPDGKIVTGKDLSKKQ